MDDDVGGRWLYAVASIRSCTCSRTASMAPPRNVAASYRDQPAQRRLVHINYRIAGVRRDTVTVKARMGSTIEVIYDVRAAQWFD